MRPYWYTAVAFAAASVPLLIAKSIFIFPTEQLWPPTIVLAASVLFTLAHLGTARNIVRWARRRAQMGLLGFGYPWEEGEEAWILMRQKAPQHDPERQQLFEPIDEEPSGATPRSCADEDSCFIVMGPITLHYKVAHPQEQERYPGACIVLIHPFAGGVFSWRNIMQPLVNQCHCPVVAFDRPGFGLTSRPPVIEGQNVYTVQYAAEIAVQLCYALGFTKAILVGHADAAVVALVASAELIPHGPHKPEVQAIGLAFVSPISMDEGEVGSPFSRLLSNSRLGRRMLVRMMRTEVGEVSNRGAWADPSLATPEIMELYKSPLRMQGWDNAMMAVTTAPKVGRVKMRDYLKLLESLPILIATGAQDRISTPHNAAKLSEALPSSRCAVLEAVGHLSHEEKPHILLGCLAPFCLEALEASFQAGTIGL
ncbi:g8839 [Coccomyxa elongata]